MIASWTLRTALAALLVVGLSGCDDDPFRIIWTANPTNGTVYSLSLPQLNLPSAFSVVERRAYRVEASGSTGRWDLAFDIQGGQAVLLPPGALGVTSEARILAQPDQTFDGIRRAPSDLEQYAQSEPVPAVSGRVYIVRSGQQVGPFGTRCIYYSKLEITEVDLDGGSLSFRFDTNPACNDRSLRPDRES